MKRVFLCLSFVVVLLSSDASLAEPVESASEKIIDDAGVVGALLVLSLIANAFQARHIIKLYDEARISQKENMNAIFEMQKLHANELMKVLIQQAEMSARFTDVSERVIRALEKSGEV